MIFAGKTHQEDVMYISKMDGKYVKSGFSANCGEVKRGCYKSLQLYRWLMWLS